jgi:transposase, IS30 family
MGKHFKHLTWNDRLYIEKLCSRGNAPKDIADIVGCCVSTIYNELRRGRYVHTNSDLTEEVRYSPDMVQAKYDENMKNKGPGLKIGNDRELADYIEDKILNEKYSPQAALYEVKKEEKKFSVEIKSVNTIYSYIRKGVFLNLSMEHLHRENKRSKEKVKRAKRPPQGTSIEKRPDIVSDREQFGHWEMDCVKGKRTNGTTLLVLTERKTRYEIIKVLRACSADEVRKALNRIEKEFKSSFYSIFHTITVDNGSEFADVEAMEKALYRVGKRTDIYYCHPYRSCERGSNENQNRLIRYFYPKGTDFDKVVKRKDVRALQAWINNYPRKLFDGGTAEQAFRNECEKLGVTV